MDWSISWYSASRLAGLAVAAILIGIMLLPLQALLVILGIGLVLGGGILLWLASWWGAVLILPGAGLIVLGIRMQRGLDRRQAETIRDDIRRVSSRNEFYVGPER